MRGQGQMLPSLTAGDAASPQEACVEVAKALDP